MVVQFVFITKISMYTVLNTEAPGERATEVGVICTIGNMLLPITKMLAVDTLSIHFIRYTSQ